LHNSLYVQNTPFFDTYYVRKKGICQAGYGDKILQSQQSSSGLTGVIGANKIITFYPSTSFNCPAILHLVGVGQDISGYSLLATINQSRIFAKV